MTKRKKWNPLRKKDRRSELDKAIDSLIENMRVTDPASKEYRQMVKALEKLKELRDAPKDRRAEILKTVIPALLLAGFGLVEILFILNAEKNEKLILKSKAFSFVTRGR